MTNEVASHSESLDLSTEPPQCRYMHLDHRSNRCGIQQSFFRYHWHDPRSPIPMENLHGHSEWNTWNRRRGCIEQLGNTFPPWIVGSYECHDYTGSYGSRAQRVVKIFPILIGIGPFLKYILKTDHSENAVGVISNRGVDGGVVSDG